MRATLQDEATITDNGYSVNRVLGLGGVPAVHQGRPIWELLDPDGDNLSIGSGGCGSFTRWEAVAEGLARIAQDQRYAV